jgi:hypothetical protein
MQSLDRVDTQFSQSNHPSPVFFYLFIIDIVHGVHSTNKRNEGIFKLKTNYRYSTLTRADVLDDAQPVAAPGYFMWGGQRGGRVTA